MTHSKETLQNRGEGGETERGIEEAGGELRRKASPLPLSVRSDVDRMCGLARRQRWKNGGYGRVRVNSSLLRIWPLQPLTICALEGENAPANRTSLALVNRRFSEPPHAPSNDGTRNQTGIAQFPRRPEGRGGRKIGPSRPWPRLPLLFSPSLKQQMQTARMKYKILEPFIQDHVIAESSTIAIDAGARERGADDALVR